MVKNWMMLAAALLMTGAAMEAFWKGRYTTGLLFSSYAFANFLLMTVEQ